MAHSLLVAALVGAGELVPLPLRHFSVVVVAAAAAAVEVGQTWEVGVCSWPLEVGVCSWPWEVGVLSPPSPWSALDPSVEEVHHFHF